MTEATTVEVLLRRHGTTYAADAGIRLTNEPAPLWQLLVLTQLLSARITSHVAIAPARELFRAGYRTPQEMQAASWRERVRALGRDGAVAEDVRRG
ncbi:hypothetical protein GCM10023350_43630 [Nocardioides endophyticus]|uniref:Endonuclease n=1 Tax=Nocardioides endophyticus TaxID=1353775 RepID=A0ABP8ZDP9_9ACTN